MPATSTTTKKAAAPKTAAAPSSSGLFTTTDPLLSQPIGGQTLPSTSNISSGLTGIDALIAQQMQMVAGQQQTANAQSLLLQKQQAKQQKANTSLLASLQSQLAANPDPSNVTPPPPSMSDADVQQASDQVRIDAAKRLGQQKSLLVGNQMGGMGGGTMSTATGLRSLLG